MQESKKKYEVPVFTKWVDAVIKENKTILKERKLHEKSRKTIAGIKTIQASTTPNATSD